MWNKYGYLWGFNNTMIKNKTCQDQTKTRRENIQSQLMLLLFCRHALKLFYKIFYIKVNAIKEFSLLLLTTDKLEIVLSCCKTW